MLARCEPQGGGKITPLPECTTVTQRTGKRTGCEWTNTAQFQQTACHRIGFDGLVNSIIKIGYPTVKMPQVLRQIEQQGPKCVGQAVLRIL